MSETVIHTWRDFIDWLKTIESSDDERLNKGSSLTRVYRGQSNADWSLTSTLERAYKEAKKPFQYEVSKYYKLLNCASNYIASYESNFPTFENQDIQKLEVALSTEFATERLLSASYNDELKLGTLVHFRHLGFPSPLLDWTKSPYIALFFACHDGETEGAIHSVFQKKKWRENCLNEPYLIDTGDNIKTHPRHHAQQAVYTLFAKLETIAGEGNKSIYKHNFVSMTDMSIGNKNNYHFEKITISKESKKDFLKQLDKMNINNFTLFHDVESLLKTAFFRNKDYFLPKNDD